MIDRTAYDVQPINVYEDITVWSIRHSDLKLV